MEIGNGDLYIMDVRILRALRLMEFSDSQCHMLLNELGKRAFQARSQRS